MTPNKDQVAERLAQAHYEADSGIKDVYRLLAKNEIENRSDEPIKLLEVNEETVPVGVEPVYFAPHSAAGIFWPLVIVAITPEEFRKKETERELRKNGWCKGKLYVRHPVARAV